MKEGGIKYCDTARFITALCTIVVISACGTLGCGLSSLALDYFLHLILEFTLALTGRVLLSIFETGIESVTCKETPARNIISPILAPRLLWQDLESIFSLNPPFPPHRHCAALLGNDA